MAHNEEVRLPGQDAAGEEAFRSVLRDAVEAVERSGLPFLVLGGIASALVGRPRWTHDVDLLVLPDDALRALQALRQAGFETEETDPVWIYKGFKRGVLVDVIFMVMGGIYLDQEMLTHAIIREYEGLPLRIPCAEDQVVIKAIVHKEETSRHWFDALGIIARSELDWDYVLHRSRRGARRVLSLLVYAQSNDVLVPSWVIRRLYQEVYAE
jgi:putative nucleotidyltransferase-like protein